MTPRGEGSDETAVRAALERLRAENVDLSRTLETLYRLNHELENENESLKRQRGRTARLFEPAERRR